MSVTPRAPVGRAFSEAARLVAAGQRVALVGQASAGKSTVLQQLARAPELAHRRLFHVRMPVRGDDAGPVALATLAAQLEGDALAVVQDVGRPWATKLSHCIAALSASSEAVVFVDDARIAVPGEPTHVFEDRATEFLAELVDARNVGVAFSATVQPGFHVERFDVKPRLDSHELASHLEALANVPSLNRAAEELLPFASALARRSPLEVRLAVALVSLNMRPHDVVRIAGPRPLARAFLTRLPDHLQAALNRLNVLRMPCDLSTRNELLGGAAATGPFPIDGVALEQTSDGWMLPSLLAEELVALDAERRLPPDSARVLAAHQAAAAFHERQFTVAKTHHDVPGAVRHELEVVYQLTHAGDARAVLDRSLWFIDQYNALGKALGTRGKDIYYRVSQRPSRPRDAGPPADAEALLRQAILSYERALAHDSQDAYALHYRAYNHDILADDASAVEQGYRAARDEDPDRVWHHGRLITFLITRGRPRDAHAEWDEALRQLDGLRKHPWLYRELHRALALLLLHRGNVDFADEVLADVPEEISSGGWFPALRRRLVVLREYERHVLVFPPSTPRDDRWAGPRLALNASVDRWLPGRIESIDEERVHVRFADRDSDGQEVYGYKNYTHEDFAAVCEIARAAMPPSGTFVEILWLSGAATEVVRCHATAIEDDLPAPFPPSDRYLNRGAARTSR